MCVETAGWWRNVCRAPSLWWRCAGRSDGCCCSGRRTTGWQRRLGQESGVPNLTARTGSSDWCLSTVKTQVRHRSCEIRLGDLWDTNLKKTSTKSSVCCCSSGGDIVAFQPMYWLPKDWILSLLCLNTAKKSGISCLKKCRKTS